MSPDNLSFFNSIKYEKNFTMLHKVAFEENIEQAKQLLKDNLIDINTKTDLTSFVPLHIAAFTGCTELVLLFIEKGATVNIKNHNGLIPLHLAVMAGHFEVIRQLILHGALVKGKNKDGYSPLHYASFWKESCPHLRENERVEIVDLLLRNGGDQKINARTKDEKATALSLALDEQHNQVAELLLNKEGIDVNCPDIHNITSLHKVVHWGNKEMTKCLIDKRANINAQNDLGKTALHIAVETTNTELVKLLINQKGAELKLSDEQGLEPIHIAAFKGSVAIIDLLLEEGIYVNTTTHNFKRDQDEDQLLTPLHCASKAGKVDAVECLLARKANVNAATLKKHQTPLHYAAQGGYVTSIPKLIKYGATINAQDAMGFTPLLHTAYEAKPEAIKELINCKADIYAKSKLGLTILHCLAGGWITEQKDNQDKERAEIVKYLFKHESQHGSKKRFNINAQIYHNNMMAALHLAVLAHRKAVVEALGEYDDNKINPNIKDEKGNTPLHLAMLIGDAGIQHCLLKIGANIHIPNKENKTPLHFAKEKAKEKTILINSYQNIVRAKNINNRICLDAKEKPGSSQSNLSL